MGLQPLRARARAKAVSARCGGLTKPQGATLLKFEWPLYEGGLLQNKLTLAQSKREEAEAALKERTDQALREVALAYDQVDTGLQQYDAAIAL